VRSLNSLKDVMKMNGRLRDLGFLATGFLLGSLRFVEVPQSGAVSPVEEIVQSCDPTDHRILPDACLTKEFYGALNTSIENNDYDGAVDSFMNPDEKDHTTTLGTSYDGHEHLVRRLDLQPFLANVDVCGTEETRTCEELLIDPSCGCVNWDYSSSDYVAEHITSVRVQPLAEPQSGRVNVRFDQDMQYAVINGADITIETLPLGTPYQTTFTQHWDVVRE
jgi:hypothetical protein